MSTLRISRRAADRLRSGHLWVYRSDLEAVGASSGTQDGPASGAQDGPAPGALVTLVDSRQIPLGTALYSSASMLAARLVSRQPGLTREGYLREIRTRVAAALQLRRELAPMDLSASAAASGTSAAGFGTSAAADSTSAGAAVSNAQRLIFAEADGLPGIVADRYNDLVILQLLTQGTAQDDVRAAIVDALREGLAGEGAAGESAGGENTVDEGRRRGRLTIWERPDPRIREMEQLAAPAPGPLFSTAEAETAPATTIFTLNGLRFHYDAASGQKTGAFLDQRLNYAAAAQHVAAARRAEMRALDVCTYQGGFALHLAQVCERVTGVDASRSPLEAADRNLLLNPQLAGDAKSGGGREVDWMEADAFEYLRHLDETARGAAKASAARAVTTVSQPDRSGRFDAIVLDPPAFAKSSRSAEGALRGYKELNLRALRLLAKGGTLITCSCSQHVSLADFTAVVASAASDAGRRVQLLETRGAAPDHPEVLTLPETRYLKCLICRVD